MDNIRIIKYKTMEIFYTDISNTKPEESIPMFIRNREIVAEKKFKEKSVFSLVNAENARFNSKLIQTIKETTKSNNPYIRATTVTGLSQLTKTIVNSIVHFTGRDIKVFDTVEQGQEYLFEIFRQEQLAKAHMEVVK
ncbi:MAG TPA: hypothetical protein DCE41_01605 [Cytophagales bacterium]|nr:hypothetical protein [Cytophagales bacterium]HAA20017.1 hypothetical protein [Cytophagales bacterium]HAP64658.1 hypothetical protein [Cytophagales bacterium]